jgi:hypothetical protein
VKMWGSASTPGVELGPPRCLSSNRRERAARKNLRNVGDTGAEARGAAVKKTTARSWGGKLVAPHDRFELRFTAST